MTTLKIEEALRAADAALKSAEKLAWETGCETVDGVYVLLADSRGDLYREIVAARELVGTALAPTDYEIMKQIGDLQAVQRRTHYRSAEWQRASAELAPLFAEMARRYPNGGLR